MLQSLKLNYRILFPISILIIFGIGLYLISNLQLFPNPSALSFGIGIDLTLITSTIYFLWIRKKSIPNISVVPFFVVSTLLTSYLLPNQYQGPIPYILDYVIPCLELGVIGYISFTVYKLKANFKSKNTSDFINEFRKVAGKSAGK